MSDLHELAAAIDGDAILPGSPRYEAARLVANSRFDDVRPAAVVRVASAADVATVVDFARDGGLSLVARSGGHSFAGRRSVFCARRSGAERGALPEAPARSDAAPA